jgi:hypothetical protein
MVYVIKKLGIWGALCISLGLLVTLYGSLYFDLFCGGHSFPKCEGIPYLILAPIQLLFSFEYIWEFLKKAQYALSTTSVKQELHLEGVSFFLVLIFFHLLIIIRPAFRFLKKFIKLFVAEDVNTPKEEKRSALLIMILILLPLIIITIIKWQYIPFRYSSKLVTIEMWNSQLSVPRNLLKDWSLFPYPQEARGQAFMSYIGKIRVTGETPFARFQVNTSNIDSSIGLNESIDIYVRPSPEKKAGSDQYSTRDKILANKLKARTSEDEMVYSQPIQLQGMELYKAKTNQKRLFKDILVSRNKDEEIKNILECTPDEWCSSGYHVILNFKEGTRERVRVCNKICNSSINVSSLHVSYSFDKKNLTHFLDFPTKVESFIESFIVE